MIRPEHISRALNSGALRVPVITTYRTEAILQLVEEEVADLIRQASDHIENTPRQARSKLTSYTRLPHRSHVFRRLASRAG